MMDERMARRLIDASNRLYRLLLGSYPRQFRQEYGPQMAQVFYDCCRDTVAQAGVLGLARLWLRTLGDMAATAPREHLAIARSAKTPDYAEERSAAMPAFSPPARMRTDLKNFTKRAVNALELATEEARVLNHAYIGTEHLLLGLLREQKGASEVVLHQLGLTLDQAREATQALLGTGKRPSPEVQPLSKRAVQAIDRAIEEAQQFNHSFVGTEHLLLGVIETSEGAAVGVLDRLGLPADEVRTAVLRALKQR